MGKHRKIAISPLTNLLVTLASIVVILAGMRVMAPILMPLLFSVFISIICWSPLSWLHRRGMPFGIAISLIILGIMTVMVLLTIIVGTSIESFIRNLSQYQAELKQHEVAMFAWLNSHDIDIFDDEVVNYLDPGKIMVFAGNAVSKFGNLFTNAFLILLSVAFLLLEAVVLPAKLRTAFGGETALIQFGKFVSSVKSYLAIKTFTSLATGLIIWIWLSILNIQYAILWSIIAFLFNFIPNIGSILASLPVVLLALIQYGPISAGYTALGYLVVNILIGSIIEPRVMSNGVGLSTLVVFLSLVFWGWMFGPIGMLFSVPFTMIFKIGLENIDETQWIAILLDSGKNDRKKEALTESI